MTTYPLGRIYGDAKGGLFKIAEHGHLSLRIERLNTLFPVDGWIGTSELCDWLRVGHVSEAEEKIYLDTLGHKFTDLLLNRELVQRRIERSDLTETWTKHSESQWVRDISESGFSGSTNRLEIVDCRPPAPSL